MKVVWRCQHVHIEFDISRKPRVRPSVVEQQEKSSKHKSVVDQRLDFFDWLARKQHAVPAEDHEKPTTVDESKSIGLLEPYFGLQ